MRICKFTGLIVSKMQSNKEIQLNKATVVENGLSKGKGIAILTTGP